MSPWSWQIEKNQIQPSFGNTAKVQLLWGHLAICWVAVTITHKLINSSSYNKLLNSYNVSLHYDMCEIEL